MQNNRLIFGALNMKRKPVGFITMKITSRNIHAWCLTHCFCCIALIFTWLTVLACSDESLNKPVVSTNQRPILLISIDSLRADHCSLYGYKAQFAPDLPTTPFLEKLAKEGVRFDQAISPSSWTLPAHMSLLTGLGPIEHGVRDRHRQLPEDVMTLAEHLRLAGYSTAGFFSGPLLHPAWGFGRGFDVYRGVVDYSISVEAIVHQQVQLLNKVYDKSHHDAQCSERVVDSALKWLGQEQQRSRSWFLFLHLWDPHYDYHPPAELARKYDPAYKGLIDGSGFMERGKRWAGRELAHWKALYDAEIRATDDQIARLWKQMEEWGIADDIILLITSDHGDEFFEHGRKGHNKTLFEEVVHVPMLLRASELVPENTVVTGQVGLVDVFPTLLDLTGTPIPSGLSGETMRPLWTRKNADGFEHTLDLYAPSFRSELRGWRRGSNKVIWDRQAQIGVQFDLETDPHERSGVFLSDRHASPFVPAWQAWEDAEQRARTPETMKPPEEIQAELERIGYAGGD